MIQRHGFITFGLAAAIMAATGCQSAVESRHGYEEANWFLPKQDTALLLPSNPDAGSGAEYAARGDWPSYSIVRDPTETTIHRQFYVDRQGSRPQIDYFDRTTYSARTSRGHW